MTDPGILQTPMILQLYMTGAALFFYGIYIILFILAIVTLSRRETAGKTVLLIANWLMAVLGTAQVILTLASCVVLIQMSQNNLDTSINPNASAFGLALRGELDNALFMARSIVWCINKNDQLAGSGVLYGVKHSTSALARQLESGALYCICVILLVITGSSLNSISGDIALNVLAGLTFQMTNIAPTLTIVRVGLGHNIQDTIEEKAAKPTNQRNRLVHGPVEEPLPSSSEVLHLRPEVCGIKV
ncbi:hypothetical protein GGX14DRAFT_609755 [Mycena pura]|uniref:Uncharacterized protein n=1 Tax=Mycena pura TaxID=153505 RepID=A0AAD6YJB8_9AGAR|nr:hypothetical protein GGX14DRAFT_609755 [Mycena pura]